MVSHFVLSFVSRDVLAEIWFLKIFPTYSSFATWGCRVMRNCWVHFQCRGVLLIWIIIGQGPIALAVGAGGGGLDIFYRVSFLLSFSLSGRRPDID